jgi:hypothetical protein
MVSTVNDIPEARFQLQSVFLLELGRTIHPSETDRKSRTQPGNTGVRQIDDCIDLADIEPCVGNVGAHVGLVQLIGSKNFRLSRAELAEIFDDELCCCDRTRPANIRIDAHGRTFPWSPVKSLRHWFREPYRGRTRLGTRSLTAPVSRCAA